MVVALSALGLRAARRLLRKQVGLDVLVAGGQGIEAQPWDEAERVGGTWMVQSHIQGGRVSRLRLEVKGNGPLALGGSAEAATAQRRFGYDVTPIHWDLPEEAAVAAEMARYNQELKAINLAAAGTLPPAKPGEAVYVGAARCLECHEQVEAFWAKNEHAHAWETLEKDQKTFDLECVSCHVTGYGRPGGSILGALKNLTSVQCEACHGPGSRHVEAGDTAAILRSPGPDVCTTCHNPKHSTGFDYKKYRARLLVPGHGK